MTSLVFRKSFPWFMLIFVLMILSEMFSAAAFQIKMEPSDFAPFPAFSVPDKGCALYIDLDKCIMTVYVDGIVKETFPVSGGKESTPSPVGTWKVVHISNWGGSFGGSWIGLNVPWGRYGIHGTVTPWILGKRNVSHGCIRMNDSDVDEVKQLISLGSVVHIKQNSLPFRALKNGMFGSDVYDVQQMLQDQGFYDGELDGKFGNELEQAVKEFQKTNRVMIDGIVGDATFDLICERRE